VEEIADAAETNRGKRLAGSTDRPDAPRLTAEDDMADQDRVRVPGHSDHRFRGKPIAHSGRSRSPIPEQADR
jgi:hypothetical protein